MDMKTQHSDAQSQTEVRVWDLPTRIFHWSLALAFLVAALSSEDQWLKVHALAGELIAGLLVFRLVWGLVGGYYSRFRQFSYSYRDVKEHLFALLMGRNKHYLSHNPAGSWSVLVMLIGTSIVVFGGLLLLGGEEQHGIAQSLSPLFGTVAGWVHIIVGNLLIGFIFVHIAGVVVDSKLTGDNLLKSMITGYKTARAGSISVKQGLAGCVLLVLLVATISGGLANLNGADPFHPLQAFQHKPLQQSQLWNESCADCHMTWHPSLLPARSWKKILAEQSDHFGEDLFLEKKDADKLLKFALANSAEHGLTEPARKINASIDPQVTPLRITETPYWQDKHDEIGTSVWKRQLVSSKSNCAACHSDARQGLFEDSAMHIPN